MTLINRSRRYLDLLSRLFNAPEGRVAIGDISPGIALETEDAQELDLPRGWRRYGQVWSVAAVAGQAGEFILDNPASSKTLIRVEALGFLSATAAGDSCQLKLGFGVSLAGWTDQGAGQPMDDRIRSVGGYQISAGHLYTRNSATSFGGARFGILYPAANNVMQYASRAEARVVLDPGSSLIWSGTTQNIVQRAFCVWTERFYDSWEKFPVQ